MYKIIGADRKEYGPVSAEQLRQWIAEGRVNAATLIQPEGASVWKPVSSFPEFAGAVAIVPPTLTPTYAATAPKTNAMAITGLVMGIVSVTFGIFCCGFLFSILGIIFSCIALAQLNKNPDQKGKGMAIAGLVLSVFGILSNVLLGMLVGLSGFKDLKHWP